MAGATDRPSLFLGVDVGTGSTRAGVFDASGRLLGTGARTIRIWRAGARAEQSSEDIWQAVCRAVRAALAEADVAPGDLAGIGFDATCSLVALSPEGAPVSVSASGDTARNIIVWMDQLCSRRSVVDMGHGPLARSRRPSDRRVCA